MKKNKMSSEEMLTASWYFAMSNMAMHSPSVDKELAKDKSWDERTGTIKQHCFRMLECEMEVEGMEDEMNSWMKDFKKGNKFCMNEWAKYKNQIGI